VPVVVPDASLQVPAAHSVIPLLDSPHEAPAVAVCTCAQTPAAEQ
jgi:hypothetical protein